MKRERIQVSLDSRHWQWLRKQSAKTGASIAELIRRALDRCCQDDQKPQSNAE